MNYIAKKIALQEKNILNHADLYLDYNNRIAFHKNRKINLTVKEFDILFFLASYPGQVFTHRQIYETVWGKEYFCDEGNVTAHIGHIRKKIELDPRNPVFIQTVRGIGYKFPLFFLYSALLPFLYLYIPVLRILLSSEPRLLDSVQDGIQNFHS